MAYHENLLTHAQQLLYKNVENPEQADLRRSVSSAYYALFHLLIDETVANWRYDESRNGLARMFEHRVMAKASAKILDSKSCPFTGEDPEVVQKLKMVAQSFGQLQEARNTADYDNATFWTFAEAFEMVRRATEAYFAFDDIKGEKIAQNYLVSLLIRPRT